MGVARTEKATTFTFPEEDRIKGHNLTETERFRNGGSSEKRNRAGTVSEKARVRKAGMAESCSRKRGHGCLLKQHPRGDERESLLQ